MNKMRERAQAQFPIVLLTLISIIQALALELLWGKLTGGDFLFAFSLEALIGWAMVSVVLLGILQIWVMYSTLVIGFTWRPSLRDSIVPFILGIQEFLLVELLHPDSIVLWLLALASIFIVANWIAHISYRRARHDESNAAFFVNLAPATWRDFRLVAILIFLFFVFALAIFMLDRPVGLMLAAVIYSNIALLIPIFSSRRLWARIMDLEDCS